ncbi:MAG: hypothetical protein C4308_04195 [Chitinophagaceae bacterium]
MKVKVSLLLILTSVAFYSYSQNSLSIAGDFQTFSSGLQGGVMSSSVTSFKKKGDVVGSQFLFTDWVKGMITANSGIQFSDGLFNFDKMGQKLFVLVSDSGKTNSFAIDKSQVKSVTLTDGNKSYTFERIPSLNKDQLYILLAKGPKYSLYASVKTTFIASDYSTNGIVSSGNMYDEYKDEYSYNIVLADGSVHEISLKRKAIKTFFAADKVKLEEFLKTHDDSSIDEKFLSLLVVYLNQEG